MDEIARVTASVADFFGSVADFLRRSTPTTLQQWQRR
jgi:hypothetical protein